LGKRLQRHFEANKEFIGNFKRIFFSVVAFLLKWFKKGEKKNPPHDKTAIFEKS